MVEVGTESFVDSEDIRAEETLEVTWLGALTYTDKAMEGATPCDFHRVAHDTLLSGYFQKVELLSHVSLTDLLQNWLQFFSSPYLSL